MKATGIVRRLDDLGRLVIPKEIRKQYRLKEGDSIEFFIENDHIVIQKFDIMSKQMEEINLMVETLQEMYHETVLFMQEEWLRQHHCLIREDFFKSIRVHRVSAFEGEYVFQEDSHTYSGVVYPVIVTGDWYGGFVMLFEQHRYRHEGLRAIEAYCELLTRQQTQ